jgi:hypothetical protein
LTDDHSRDTETLKSSSAKRFTNTAYLPTYRFPFLSVNVGDPLHADSERRMILKRSDTMIAVDEDASEKITAR